MKKRLALLVTISLVFTPLAHGAPKKVALKKISIIADAPAAEMLLASKTSIITIATVDSKTTDIALQSNDVNGAVIWQKVIDSGVDEVAMASAVDNAGNIWLAGYSSRPPAAIIETNTVLAENPDLVVVEQLIPLRGDLSVLTLWKIAATGEVLTTYTYQQESPGLINAISVNNSGISIAGAVSEKSFLQNMSAAGAFSTPITVGSGKTTINAVVRNSDGSSSLFGSSTETLGGKKLAGIRDGFLMKVSKSGAVSSVVRSSAANGDRAWLSADSNFLLSGSVKVGKVTESAITKFTSTFSPTWTIRFPSTGQSRAVSAAGMSYAAIGSRSEISTISGWKPTTGQLLVIGLDAKGVVTSAFGSSELGNPIALAYSKELGIIGLAPKTDQRTAIFRIATR